MDLQLQFLKYQESWICQDLEILVTKKTYRQGHDLMILDYHPGKEPTVEQIREIYDRLSGIQTDALFLTNYNDKTQKVALLEIDLPSFLNDNILQIKLDYDENKEKKKKSDLLPDQSRRNTSLTYCQHCICFKTCNKKPFDKICDEFEFNPGYYEVSASDNTERRQ